MKKVLSFIILLALVFSIVGCDSDNSNKAADYILDYNDATSFENALNDGLKVNGKIVKVFVKEYVPDSILGINCHAGEHLNFLFEDELDVEKGDTIVVRVTEEPSKVFLIGSWKVPCELLEISGAEEKIESDTENAATSKTNDKNKETEPTEITLTMNEDDFKGIKYKDAEKKFREMGFTKFKYKTVDTENKSSANTISYIEITEFFFGDSDFKKGDKFDSDSTVTFYSYKYKEPTKSSSVFYSTKDYETAKKGNAGIFSYKNKSGSYDVYWIIDFDAGYIYYFTDGNGENNCDKIKIVSGDLNEKITIIWNYGGEKATWYLYFKYVESPVTLIVRDHLGFATEFKTTDLEDALNVRKTKTIKEN